MVMHLKHLILRTFSKHTETHNNDSFRLMMWSIMRSELASNFILIVARECENLSYAERNSAENPIIHLIHWANFWSINIVAKQTVVSLEYLKM